MPPHEPGGEGGEDSSPTEVEVTLNDAELRAGLVAACKLGRLDAVGQLLERGVDFTYLDSRGWGPLHWACFYGHHAIVELLMRVGAGDMYRDGPSFAGLVSPGMTSPGGVMSPGGTVSPSSGAGPPRLPNVVNSPLHIALSRGYVRCVWVLLAAGVSPLDVDAAGNTALHVAASAHPPSPTLRLELLTSCMYVGCDPAARNWRGFTALELLPSGDGAARALLTRAAAATQCASTGVLFTSGGDSSLRYLCASTGLFYSEGASTQAFVHAFAPALPGVTLPTQGYAGASSPLPDPVIDGASAGFVTCNDIPIAVWEGDEGLMRPIRLATEACSRVADAEAALEGALRPLQRLVREALERKAKVEQDRLKAQMDAARAAAQAAAAEAGEGGSGSGSGSGEATGSAAADPPTPVKGGGGDDSSSGSGSGSSNSSSPSVVVREDASSSGTGEGFPASPMNLEGVTGVGYGGIDLGSPMDSPTSPTPTLSGMGWGDGMGGGGGFNTLVGQRGGGRGGGGGGVPPLPLYSPPLELYAEPSHLEAIQGALAACVSARCDVAVISRALGALATVAAAGRAVAAAGELAAARPLLTRNHPSVAALEEAGREAKVFGAGKSFLGQLALARACAIAELELTGAKEAADRVPLATHAHDAIIARLSLALDTVVALEALAVRGGSGEEADAVSEEDIAQCLSNRASGGGGGGEGKEGEEAAEAEADHTSSSPTSSTLRLGVAPSAANAPPCPPTPASTLDAARTLKQRLVAEVALSDAVARGVAAMQAHTAIALECIGEDPTLLPTPPLPPPPPPPEGGAASAAAGGKGGKGGKAPPPPPPPPAKPGKGAPVVEEPPPHPPVDPTLPCDAAGVPLPHSKQLLALFGLRDSLAALEGGLGEGAAAGADGVALEAAKAALEKGKVALEEGLLAECLRCEDFRKKKKKKGGAKKK